MLDIVILWRDSKRESR